MTIPVPGAVKVGIFELDGTELDGPVERPLNVDDLPFGEYGDSVKITESGGNVTLVEFFYSSSQITSNRKASVSVTYSGNVPTTEVWQYYQSDGTTVKRTITLTHTWSGNSLVSTTEAVT